MSEPKAADAQQESSIVVASSEIWRAFYADLSGRIKDEHTIQYDTVKWIVTSEFAILGFYYVYKVPHTFSTVYLWVCGLLVLDIIGIILILIAQRGKRFARIRYINLLYATTQEFRRTYFLVMRRFSLTVDEVDVTDDIVDAWKKRYTSLLWWDRHLLVCYMFVIFLPVILFIILLSYSLGNPTS